MQPIDVYFFPTPNGQKITVYCEEAEIPYRIIPVHIGRGEQFKPEFLAISPNNRMPAIVDPDGPGGEPISVFESGAILRYLGEKTGKLYPKDVRAKTKVDEWLFWQMAGLGPMSGQAGHFMIYAKEKIPYAIERYKNEVHRLYGVMNTALSKHRFLAGDELSIADVASYPWTAPHSQYGLELEEFTHLARWAKELSERPGFERGMQKGKELREGHSMDDKAREVLFGQRARTP
jgi:GST-like protein